MGPRVVPLRLNTRDFPFLIWKTTLRKWISLELPLNFTFSKETGL